MRILLVQPSLQPPGGGNGVAAWMIEALREDHELTVLTWATVGFAEINSHFGTSLTPKDATFVRAHPRLADLLTRLPTPTDLLKTAMLMRAGRQRASEFDLAISGNNEADLGDRCLQYIHYPRYQRPRPGMDMRVFHTRAVLRLYYALADTTSGISFERMRRNQTLTNSDWTGRLVKSLHGIETTTLHPPVLAASSDGDWNLRKDRFLCVGRISPEKEIEKVIAIVEAVRARGHELGLTIAGGRGENGYMKDIAGRVLDRRDWVDLTIDVPRSTLNQLMTTHRYGLHGMSEEHFGMALAEMAASGCIVFAPSGGGQGEVLDSNPALLYSSVRDGVEKIDVMLRSLSLQDETRRRLADRGLKLGVDAFMTRFRSIVNGFGARA